MHGPDDVKNPVTGRSSSADVVAVVSSFHPDARLVDVCNSALRQAAAVVVVDDGSGPDAEPWLDTCESLGARVRRQPANCGIAAALNEGLRVAREHDPTSRAVLTLDQDSVLPDGYVEALVRAWSEAEVRSVAVGMVGPAQASGVRRAAEWSGSASARAEVLISREPIQSGLLVPWSTVDAVGFFDEDLFIDGVDTDFFLRAATHGLRAVAAPDAVLGHRLGRTHDLRLGGRTLPIVHAATFRYYYLARNRVRLLRRHGARHRAWAAGAVLRDLRHLAVVTLAVPGRRARLRETWDGLRDGLRGVTGRRPD
jgi:rhamnosyltransferase